MVASVRSACKFRWARSSFFTKLKLFQSAFPCKFLASGTWAPLLFHVFAIRSLLCLGARFLRPSLGLAIKSFAAAGLHQPGMRRIRYRSLLNSSLPSSSTFELGYLRRQHRFRKPCQSGLYTIKFESALGAATKITWAIRDTTCCACGKEIPNNNNPRKNLEIFKGIDRTVNSWLGSYWGSPECVFSRLNILWSPTACLIARFDVRDFHRL